RQGTVMLLLWRGLSEYVRHINAKFLFGCSSVKTTDPAEVVAVQDRLRSLGHTTEEYEVKPLPGCQMNLDRVKQTKSAHGQTLIPPLLDAYLRAGARVAADPALDTEFQCVDFFTVLSVDDVSAKVERRYEPC